MSTMAPFLELLRIKTLRIILWGPVKLWKSLFLILKGTVGAISLFELKWGGGGYYWYVYLTWKTRGVLNFVKCEMLSFFRWTILKILNWNRSERVLGARNRKLSISFVKFCKKLKVFQESSKGNGKKNNLTMTRLPSMS